MVILLFIILLFSTPVSATVLSDTAAGCAVGSFCEITGMTNWDSGAILVPPYSGCVAGDFAVEFANRATWNPRSKRFQFIGAPHGTCSRDILAYYDEATNGWSVSGPTPTDTNDLKHAYDQNALDPITGTHYYRYYNSQTVYKLTNNSGSWNALPNIGTSSWQCCGALEWFFDQGRLIWIDGGWGGWSYNPATNTWTHLFRTNENDGSGLPQYTMTPTYNNWSVYSRLGYIVFGSGSSFYKMNFKNAVTTAASPGFSITTGADSDCCSMAQDPASGHIVVINASDEVWDYDPVADSWSQKSVTLPSSISSTGAGRNMIAAPIPEYGVIMYIKCNSGPDCHAYVYKNSATNAADLDFLKRCYGGVGVLRCFSFDSDADFVTTGLGTETQGAYGQNYGYVPPNGSSSTANLTRDASVKTSGASSLRLTVPGNADGGEVSGLWFTNFSTDLSQQVAEGQDIYIQVSYRVDSNLLTQTYPGSGGFKVMDISGGDKPACPDSPPGSSNCPTTCWDGENVITTTRRADDSHLLVGYSNCGGTYAFKNWENMTTNWNNQRTGCIYPYTSTGPECVTLTANGWWTVQFHLHIGHYNAFDSTIDVWWAKPGESSILLQHCAAADPCATQQGNVGWWIENGNDTEVMVGKIWLETYQTGSTKWSGLQDGHVWFDNLIISRSIIPDPGAEPPLTYYTTNFPLTENPISEGGMWINGLADGLDWQDVKTTPGYAQITVGSPSGFDDPTAIVAGDWGVGTPQYVRTVIKRTVDSSYEQEFEIRLKTTISAHVNSGYEILGCGQIMRWNGDLGDFDEITNGTLYSNPPMNDGDIFAAQIVDGNFSVYHNGSLCRTASDSTFTSGAPGIGMFTRNPTPVPFGFSSFTASTSPIGESQSTTARLTRRTGM